MRKENVLFLCLIVCVRTVYVYITMSFNIIVFRVDCESALILNMRFPFAIDRWLMISNPHFFLKKSGLGFSLPVFVCI